MYYSPNIRIIKTGGHAARMTDEKCLQDLFVRRALGKTTCIWKDNNKLDLEEIGWEGAE